MRLFTEKAGSRAAGFFLRDGRCQHQSLTPRGWTIVA